jgi:Protein of unknown function (DUF742)
MSAPRDRWLDREAGPVVRPYAVTRGRTRPASGSDVDLLDVVVTITDPPPAMADPRLNREHRRILSHCRQPITVVDLASDLDLPVGVVRVLLGDLRQYGAVRVVATTRGAVTSERLLRNVLDALQSL